MLDKYIFQDPRSFSVRLLESTASCFPLDLLGVVLGPTMLEVTSKYSASENDFLRDRRLLAELEFKAIDNRLQTKGLVI